MSPFRPVTSLHVYDGNLWRPVGAQGTPGPGPTAPNPPTNLDAVPDVSSVLLTWDAPTSGAVVDYYQRRTNGATPVTVNATSENVTGLSPATVYQFEVRSVGEPPEGGGQALTSAWVSLQVTTTSSGGGSYSPLWGFTVGTGAPNGPGGESRTAAYTRIAGALGHAEMIRDFYASTTIQWPPQGGAYSSVAPSDVLYCQSWKPNYSAIMNGSQDAYILAHCAKLPTNRMTVLGAWHEWDVKYFGDGVPSNGPQTFAEYIAMQNYLADLVHSTGNQNIKWAPILGAYAWASRWGPMMPDMSKMDRVYYDPYRATVAGWTYASGYNQAHNMTDWLVANWGIPATLQGIAEIGVGGTTSAFPDGNVQGAADWTRGILTGYIERQVEAILWFESGPTSQMEEANRQPIQDEWLAARAATP